jgi:2-phospho-L-lactate/phosphoenolpyruvate guanylyltransferase
MTNNIAVIPVKGLLDSKSRLNRALAPQDKKKLILAMLKDVLRSAWDSELFDRVTVVSPDRNVEREANLEQGVFLHQEGIGLNSGIRQATLLGTRAKSASLAVVLADIPLVQPKDLEELYAVGSSAERVVLSPSLKGGTNVMIREPPDLIPSSYGRWSFSNHLRAAQKTGVPVYSVSNPRLSLDIDTPGDLISIARGDPHAKTDTSRVLREISSVHVVARASK